MAKSKIVHQNQSLIEFDIVRKFEESNAAVGELRTGIWAPVEKLSGNSLTYKKFLNEKRKRVIQTKWGEVIIKGNILTQTHRDLLDCIMANSNDIKELESGGMAFYFKLGNVLKEYSGADTANKNHNWLKQKLTEIQTTAIEFKNEQGYYSFNILSLSAFSEAQESYGIVFSPEYRKYIEEQLTVGYKKELPRLLKVESALLKAIIRFFWSHSTCNMSIEKLLETIGYPIESERSVRVAKKEIRENIEYLESFGIGYSKNEKLLYSKSRHDNEIMFIGPLKSNILEESKK